MYRAAVFSDTHGNNEPMLQAAKKAGADLLIHLGDHDRDAVLLKNEHLDIPVYSVCGNCDYAPIAPDKLSIEIGPIKAFLTHGHLYNVSPWYLDSLIYAAEEQEARLVLFGHTHQAVWKTVGGITIINPGTAGRGRELSWALVTVFDNGAISCDINRMT